MSSLVSLPLLDIQHRIADEYLEFDFRAVGDGRSAQARYANNSNYRNDSLIRKESKSMGLHVNCHGDMLTLELVCVSSLLIQEIKKIIKESEIMKYVCPMLLSFFEMPVLTPHREDDTKWPQKNKDGRQELEIRVGNEHISFEVRQLSSTYMRSYSDISFSRLPRLDPWSMSTSRRILKD